MSAPPAPPPWPVPMPGVERRLIARLRDAHATVPERAVGLDDLSWALSRRLASLARVGAVHETPGGRWYLDEPVYAEHVAHRRRMVVIAVVAAVLAAIAVSVVYR